MKARIKQNVRGNWYGYLGTGRVRAFGTDQQEANDWLADPVAYDKAEAERLAQPRKIVLRKFDWK